MDSSDWENEPEDEAARKTESQESSGQGKRLNVSMKFQFFIPTCDSLLENLIS